MSERATSGARSRMEAMANQCGVRVPLDFNNRVRHDGHDEVYLILRSDMGGLDVGQRFIAFDPDGDIDDVPMEVIRLGNRTAHAWAIERAAGNTP